MVLWCRRGTCNFLHSTKLEHCSSHLQKGKKGVKRKAEDTGPSRMLRAQERAFHPSRKGKGMTYFEKVNGPHFETFVTLINKDGKEDHVTQVVPDFIPADRPVGKLLRNLTYYHDFMPTAMKTGQSGEREVSITKMITIYSLFGIV